MSNLISNWLPPIIRKYLTSKKWKFEGDYKLWEEAKMDCDGYDDVQVVSGMKYRAELWFKSYQSKYLDLNSRNVLSHFFYPLLELNKNIVNVLDIGGAAGGHFNIVRDNVPKNITLSWTINETIAAVNEFAKSFPQTNLEYNSEIKALYDCKYDIILFSGTIQYIESPYKIIEQLKHIPHKYLILTRIPMIDSMKDRLAIQHVPKSYYSASYPIWFLSKGKLIEHLKADYEFIQTWLLENESVILDGQEIFYYGYLLRNKNFK